MSIIWNESIEGTIAPRTFALQEFLKSCGLSSDCLKGKDGTVVFIRQGALKLLRSHCESDTSREQAGVLVGYPLIDPRTKRLYVNITAAIGAPGLDSSRFRLELTDNAWDHIRTQMKRQNCTGDIVGWFHSHLGIGAFLSAQDRATQEAFFSMPWGVAIVYDPHRQETRAFCGGEGVPCTMISIR